MRTVILKKISSQWVGPLQEHLFDKNSEMIRIQLSFPLKYVKADMEILQMFNLVDTCYIQDIISSGERCMSSDRIVVYDRRATSPTFKSNP